MQRHVSNSEERTQKLFNYRRFYDSKFKLDDFIDPNSLVISDSDKFRASTIVILNYSDQERRKNFIGELFGDAVNFIIYKQPGKYRINNTSVSFSPSVQRFNLTPLFITFTSEQYRDEAMNIFLARIKDRSLVGFRIVVKYDQSISFENKLTKLEVGSLENSVRSVQNIKEIIQNNEKLFKKYNMEPLNKFMEHAEIKIYSKEVRK